MIAENGSDEDLLAVGRQVMARQPFSNLLGARLTSLAPGSAEIQLEIGPDLLQQRSVVHGGVLSFLADNALTFVGGSVLGEKVATLETKINFLSPATSGVLIARAKLIHAGRRTAVAGCEISVVADRQSVLVASAQGTIVKLG